MRYSGALTEANLRFVFERDSFAYANQLVWEYRFDPKSRATSIQFNHPPPTYAHRCFVMARSARQFFYHARFEPDRPVAEAATYRRLVREIVARSPRRLSPEEARVRIPGYDCLRSFSAAQAEVLKAECGGAWQSYVLRSHWRMILPFPRAHQARMARQLLGSLAERVAPIVHLVRFPQLTINHGIILFDLLAREPALRFAVYDPNIPTHPTELTYDPADRTFYFPANHYWPGGRVDVLEAYCGWFY